MHHVDSSSGWETLTSDMTLRPRSVTTTKLKTAVRIAPGETKGFYIHGRSHNETVGFVQEDYGGDWSGDTDHITITNGSYSTSSTPFHDVRSSNRQLAGGFQYRVETQAAAQPDATTYSPLPVPALAEGDVVKIVDDAGTCETLCRDSAAGWSPDMATYCGCTGKVLNCSTNVVVLFQDGNFRSFPRKAVAIALDGDVDDAQVPELLSGTPVELKTKTSPDNAGGSYYGTFFEIKAGPKDIEITAICAASNSNYSSATATIHCYDGKPLNRNSRTLDRDSSSWKSVGRVRDLSRGRPTTGVLDAPVTIAAGTTVGFYIHCSTGNSSIAYDDSSSPQGNADVTLIPGRKTESSTPFHDISSSERIPVGGIVYNIKVAPVVTAHSYFRELPWIADLTKSVLSYVHSSCKAGIEESFSLASAGTEGGTDTTPSANHPPSIFDSFPILAGGVSDGHVSGSSSASLHALCEQIVANADGAKGKELLDLCSNNLPSANDPAVASVHRAAFATLVWHTQHLGDAALSWSQHGSNADELVDAYEAVGTTITGWFRDHRSSGGNQTADENDADGSGDDDVRIATLHRELSVGILERAALLLDLNSKCTRQIDATRARLQAADRTHSVSVESASSVDSVESDGNAVAETMKNKKRSKWKKVKSMFKLLRTARKQSSDIMQVAAAKEIISFLLPIGDVDGDDAASIRKSMQDAENKAAVFLNGFTAVMSALDTLPAQGRHAIHATLRAKICGQGFPHPLTNMTGIQVQSKLEVCRIHHGTCAKYDELVKSHCPLETC